MFAEEEVGYLGFSQQQLEAQRAGYLQSRYYSDDDSDYVRNFLSFNEVFEICPFEVGVSYAKERREHNRLLKELTEELELKELLTKRYAKLSNGEIRRVLLARELLKRPKKLILDDPLAGLDPNRRESFRAFFKKLEAKGLKLEMRGENPDDEEKDLSLPPSSPSLLPSSSSSHLLPPPPPVVEFNRITIKFGKRVLFKDFSWTIREGERWVLRGANGAGKTTLMALITGDSPLAYSLDISVFGKKRRVGEELGPIRRRIGMISPEMQAYLGETPAALLKRALKEKIELLILDEPTMNLNKKERLVFFREIERFLKAHKKVTAICIAHHSSHIPKLFDKFLTLPS